MNAPIKTIRDRYSEEQIAAFYAAGYWQPGQLQRCGRGAGRSPG